MPKRALGAPGYGGYEYQIEVTVWFALRYILELRRCDTIEVEPANSEDIAANLQVPEEQATATVTFAHERRSCAVQIKSRGAPWNRADLTQLLHSDRSTGTRGPAPRMRPLELLERDPELCFYLLTDAQIAANLKAFAVDEVGETSSAKDNDLPSPAQGKRPPPVAAGTATRIGILHQLTAELLAGRTSTILRAIGRVPPSSLAACVCALKDGVRLRLLGRDVTATLRRAELNAILRRYGGLPEPGAAMAAFVPPSNFDEIRQRLQTKHAVLIHGPAGTGKSLCADVLAHELRTSGTEPPDVVFAREPADAQEAVRQQDHVLLVVDDPWGPHKPEPLVKQWNETLPELLAEAREDVRFIVVSRTANLEESVGKRNVNRYRPYAIELSAANYDEALRRTIIRQHLVSARQWHRDYARVHERRIFSALPTPQSLAVFARALRELRTEAEAKLDRLLEESATEAVAGKVTSAIPPNHVASGIVIWALLAAGIRLAAADLVDVRTTLRRAGAVGEAVAREVDAKHLVDLLRAAQWLPENHDHSPHPFVIDGLERLIESNGAKADDTLASLIAGWVEERRFDALAQLTERLPTRRLPLPEPVRAALWQHLRGELLRGNWRSAKAQLSRVAETADPVALVASALLKKKNKGMLASWPLPKWSEDETARVRASADARLAAERFIRDVLPISEADYRSLVGFLLETLEWDLSEVFHATLARDGLHHAHYPNVETLVSGALSGPEPDYDAVIEPLRCELRELHAWWHEYRDGEYRAAEEYEVDFGRMTHDIEAPSDRFYAPREALALAFRLRRARQGWSWLEPLASDEDVRWAWAKCIAEQSAVPIREELEALAGTRDAEAFATAVTRKDAAGAGDLVVSFVLTATHGELRKLLRALATMGEPVDVQRWLTMWAERSSFDLVRRVAVARAAAEDKLEERYAEAVAAALGQRAMAVREACRAALRDLKRIDLAQTLVPDLLEVARSNHSPIAAEATATLVLASIDADAESETVLRSDDATDRLPVLIAHGAGATSRSREFLRRALASDPHFACRLHAARALAEQATAEERRAILTLENDASGPVRKECAELIGEQQWNEGRIALLRMLHDVQDANPDTLTIYASPEYSVARAAAGALGKFDDLHPAEVHALTAFVRAGKSASQDIWVHRSVLSALVTAKEPDVASLMVEQLASSWRMEGTNGSAYPVRYSAAYGLLRQIVRGTAAAESPLVLRALVIAAESADDRLAAPALLALGFLGEAGAAHYSPLLGHEETTTERALLLAAAYSTKAGILPSSVVFERFTSHPGWSLLTFALANSDADDGAWGTYLAEHDDERRWFEHVEAKSPIHAAIRHVLSRRLLKRLTQIDSHDLREGEIPEVVGMFTMHERW